MFPKASCRGFSCRSPLRSQRRNIFGFSQAQSQQKRYQSTDRDPGLSCTSVLSYPKYDLSGPQGIPGRGEQIKRLKEYPDAFDVLVVGGGATGAGVALDATTRGLSVACLERGDFASETSSRSTKLIWAGIKYMGTATAALLSPNIFKHPVDTVSEFWGEMKMVYNCHRERRYMTSLQRHLCNWVPIAVPFTSWHVSPPPLGHWLYGFFPLLAPITFKFYDALSYFTCPSSYIMTPKRAREVFPQMTQNNLKYCAVFFEAQHNDARTNLAIAMTAAEKGAAIATYTEVVEMIKDEATGKVTGVRALDRMTGEVFEVMAKTIILAGGPFTDDLRKIEAGDKHSPAVQGAAGTHIVLPGYFTPRDMGILDYNTSDGRFLFVIPWMGHTLVGTTDKKSKAETLHNPPEDEVEWLVNECQKYLNSDIKVRRKDVLSAWRGWRPLAIDPHAPPDGPVSRDHVISENPETGVIFIAGGKWTTWREMAEEVIDRVVGPKGSKSQTLSIPLHGAEGYSERLAIKLIQKYSIDAEVAEHLQNTYGGRAWEVCEVMKPTGKPWPKFGKRLVDDFPYIDAEVVFACREYACTIEDVVSRRTRLAFLNKDAALAAIPHIAEIMARELGWSRRVQQRQIEAATAYIHSYTGKRSEKAKAYLQDAHYKTLNDVFAALDTDQSDFIDQHEIGDVAEILGFKMTKKELDAAFVKMDKDGTGRVTKEAFEDWWRVDVDSPLRKQLAEGLKVERRQSL